MRARVLKRIRNTIPEVCEAAQVNRKSLTPAESLLWNHLRSRQLGGLKFRRQHPVGRFILDFYCAEANLAVELDGEYHNQRHQQDQARTQELQSHSVKVLRYPNQQVLESLETVLSSIRSECECRLER